MASEAASKGKRRGLRLGKYEVQAHIATGGMGAVYKAVDLERRRVVALKVLSPELAARPARLERFRREARSAAKLCHENIVAVYEIGEEAGTYFLALEYVDGIDLQEHVRRRGPLPPEEARQIIIQAARALGHAYEHGIVHRDVKPSNILISERDGRPVVKLTDLGLARETKEEDLRVTSLGRTVGTVDYMAPEQARDSGAADTRSDIYSLGCTFYYLLAGQCPFPGGSVAERAIAHIEATPPDVRDSNPAVSAKLSAVLQRMLAKKPADRFQNPGELLQALEDAAPAPALTGASWPSPAVDVAPPRRWLGAVSAAFVAAGMVAAFLVIGGTGEPTSRKRSAPAADQRPVITAALSPSRSTAAATTKPPGTPASTLHKPKQDRAAFAGPLAAIPVPAEGRVYRVRRLPGLEASTFPSVAEALARTPAGEPAVIEIHDNGPLFEPAAPSLAGRSVVIRAGPGFRPLVAWDVDATPAGAAAAPRLFAVDKGSLVLEDLDVVVKWGEATAKKAPALLEIAGGTLTARGCTFSLAGTNVQGLTVVRLEGPQPSGCRLSRCFARGGNMVALHLDNPGAEVLLDDSLVVGGDRPLYQVHGQGPTTVRLMRSTLVAGKTLLAVAPRTTGAVNVYCCDSLLAVHKAQTDGTLAELGAGVAAGQLHWNAMNSVYAGWKVLVSADDHAMPATALADWRRIRGDAGSDKALPESWTRPLREDPAEVAPANFATAGMALHVTAITRPGPVGCATAALPVGRSRWSALTYDPYPLALPSLPTMEGAPVAPTTPDGLYHGEKVTLRKGFDLGKHLRDQLARHKPGPVIALHLTGSGDQPTSPLRVWGVGLVLTFEEPRGFADPLTLTPADAAGDREALIEVAGGDLELRGARIVYPSARSAPVPRHVLKVSGGNLRLAGCYLRGQLASTTEDYEGLITLAGSAKVHTCAITECILLSGRTVLQLPAGGVRLRLHQSLALAADDFLVLDTSVVSAWPPIHCSLEHNTLAARRTLIDVTGGAASVHDNSQPIIIRAEANFLVAPWAGPASVLRCTPEFLARGLLVWQGKGNGYDRRRLHRYVTAAGQPSPRTQPFWEWTRLWGAAGERVPLVVDMPPGPIDMGRPQLRLLAMPATAVAGASVALPGADFVRLGIAAGKK
jgi:hypothetical protein